MAKLINNINPLKRNAQIIWEGIKDCYKYRIVLIDNQPIFEQAPANKPDAMGGFCWSSFETTRAQILQAIGAAWLEDLINESNT